MIIQYPHDSNYLLRDKLYIGEKPSTNAQEILKLKNTPAPRLKNNAFGLTKTLTTSPLQYCLEIDLLKHNTKSKNSTSHCFFFDQFLRLCDLYQNEFQPVNSIVFDTISSHKNELNGFIHVAKQNCNACQTWYDKHHTVRKKVQLIIDPRNFGINNTYSPLPFHYQNQRICTNLCHKADQDLGTVGVPKNN